MDYQIFAAFSDELEKIAADAPLSNQNISAAGEGVSRLAKGTANYLNTAKGRNVGLAALGVGGVAAGTLYARKKLKDMKQGARERRMRELSQG